MTDALRREGGGAYGHHRETIAQEKPRRPIPAHLAAGLESLRNPPPDRPMPATGHVRRLVAQLQLAVCSARRRARPLWCLSPEQKAARKARRRYLASSPKSLLVDEMLAARVEMTQGELAVAAVIAEQHAKFGSCTLSLEGLAHAAGVTRSTVIRAKRKLARWGFIRDRQRRRRHSNRNFTNFIDIIHAGWVRRIAVAISRRWQGSASVKTPIQQTRGASLATTPQCDWQVVGTALGGAVPAPA